MKVKRDELIGYLFDAALHNLSEVYFYEKHGMAERAQKYRARGEFAKSLAVYLTEAEHKALDFDC